MSATSNPGEEQAAPAPDAAEAGLVVRRRGPVLELELDRPAVHNAFDGALIEAMLAALTEAERDDEARVIVLRAAGGTFCAGADLAWMAAQARQSGGDNAEGAQSLASLFRRLDRYPKPVVARVQGSAVGGGVGLVSCCDVVIAAERARFGLSEVRLGLAPAVISPFVLARLGAAAARRYFLTGERFGATEALRFGLVSEVVADGELDAAVDRVLEALLAGGPHAQRACKQLVFDVSRMGQDGKAVDAHTAALIATLRASEEGREGMMAFLQKRPPSYHRELPRPERET